jgi:hypothetical protein
MNPRIKQLAEQAGFDLYEDGNFHSSPPGQWINQEISQLAELIIRECADVGSYYGGNVKYMILQHFGVK